MKLYKNLVSAIATTLQEIFNNNRYADKALERLLKQNAKWGSRDRRFVAEAVYDIVRNYRLYAHLAGNPKNYWFMTAVWLVVKGREVPAWQEFQHVDVDFILMKEAEAKQNPALYESFPDWLWELGTEELGSETWEQEAKAMNSQASVYLRVNTLKTSRKKLQQALLEDKIETLEVEGVETALELKKRENIFQHVLFREGWFEVQDAGSQMISDFLGVKSNDLVIDACAGAGGKSLHLAALMGNKGKVISLDVEQWKLDELKKRARRAGAFNIETKLITDKTISTLTKKADKLLLDVPCSGLGVLKRNPDAKWKLSPEVIERTRALQKKILWEYCELVKEGGYLVYSTCSILQSENNHQVEAFVNERPEYKLLTEKTLYPSQGFDGFYMALLKREVKL
jgi:16S rRNA (cytosine967-C5)-methyltransferase